MQFLLASLVAAVAAGPVTAVDRSVSMAVRAVVDGDTIDVAGVGRVRLLGIDAPELGRGYDTPAPFAREARDRLASLVLHRFVRLEQDGAPLDVYNRRLAYVVRDDGLFVNAAILREGLARVTARVALARLSDLKRAEAEAQSLRRGIWGTLPAAAATGYTRGAGTRTGASPRARAPRPRGHKKKR